MFVTNFKEYICTNLIYINLDIEKKIKYLEFFFSSSNNHDLLITVSNNGRMFKWIEPWLLFDVSRNGFQTLTIPVPAMYKIELVAPGNSCKKHPGVRIIGKFELKKGQKITAALGQQGSHDWCGSGGSFLVLESDEGQKPLLIAGGAGCANLDDAEFGRGNIIQAAVGNKNVGKSGKQKKIGFLDEIRSTVQEQDSIRHLECQIWRRDVWRRNRTKMDSPAERELIGMDVWWKGDSEAEEGSITGKSMGKRSFISQRAAA